MTSIVAGSPAAKAGLKAATGSQVVNGQQYATGGDVITAIDGHSVSSADTLQTEVAGRKPGTKVTLTVIAQRLHEDDHRHARHPPFLTSTAPSSHDGPPSADARRAVLSGHDFATMTVWISGSA